MLIPAPVRIDPDAVYPEAAVLLLPLHLSSETLAKARKSGALHFVRRGRHTFYCGRDLLAWLTPTSAGAPTVGQGVGRG